MIIKNTDYIIKNFYEERKKIINYDKEKFYHYTKDKVLDEEMCDFIINESEKFANNNKSNINPTGWTTKRHRNYPTTDLPIKEIPVLKNFIFNFIVIDIFNFIEEKYNVNKYHLSFNDIFIVKYENGKQNHLGKHADGSLFSFNILLNDPNDFEGGGTRFYYKNNVISCQNTKGGLIIHSGNVHHEGIPITKGIRYILVGFIGYLKDFIDNSKNNNKNMIEKNVNITNDNFILNESDLIKISDNKFRNQQKFNCWNINLKDNFFYEKIINSCNFKGLYLLDTNKKEYSYVEKLVKELVIFHSIRLNTDFMSDSYFIEFWTKNQDEDNSEHRFHIDKDEIYLQNFGQLFIPILSTVTYLSSSSNPTIITNIPSTSSNFNNINQQNLIISFPKKLNHISFQGKYIHGVKKIKLFDEKYIDKKRITLMFNIWARKPYSRDFYVNYDDKISQDLIENLNENLNYEIFHLEQDKIKFINNNLINNNNINYINVFHSLLKNSNKDYYYIN